MFKSAVVLAVTVLLSGCFPPQYIPGASQAYLFSDTSRLHLAALCGSGGYDGHLAWSPVNHFAVSAAGSYLYEWKDSMEHNRRSYGELALFYFSSLERNGKPVDIPDMELRFIEYTMFGRLAYSIVCLEGQFGMSVPMAFDALPCLTTAVGVRLRL